jgi:hypothetical protein
MGSNGMTSTAEHRLRKEALRTVSEVARHLGAGQVNPVFLHYSEHISILLPSMASVARMLPGPEDDIAESLSQELAVAHHLLNKQAPIVSPCLHYPAGPHFHDRFGLTLWQYVEHIPADGDDPAQMASAADALRHIHHALADYPGELPLLANKTDRCGALLEQGGALPALARGDRRFLFSTYHRIVASMDKLSPEYVPLHGDAGPHNVFITPAGARYGDFNVRDLQS